MDSITILSSSRLKQLCEYYSVRGESDERANPGKSAIANAKGLPNGCYVNPKMYQQEQDEIFTKGWAALSVLAMMYQK